MTDLSTMTPRELAQAARDCCEPDFEAVVAEIERRIRMAEPDPMRTGVLSALFMDEGFLSGDARQSAERYKHLGEEYIRRVFGWVRKTYPSATAHERRSRVLAALRDRYDLPDHQAAQKAVEANVAAEEAELAARRAKREARKKPV